MPAYSSLIVLGLARGNWAEWVGGVGTVLTFGATSLAIWQGHRLRRVEHREAMYDEALKVILQVGRGNEYVDVETSDGTKERKPVEQVVV
jgi:hypothetical protein